MSKRYDRDFKEFILKLVVEEFQPQSQVSREHDIPVSTLSRWVREYRRENERGSGELQYFTAAELKKIEKEYSDRIKDLEEENAILKKAAHIFMKNPE